MSFIESATVFTSAQTVRLTNAVTFGLGFTLQGVFSTHAAILA